MATKGRSLAEVFTLTASASANDIVLGDSSSDRLYLPGLGIDTDIAIDNQVIIWNDSSNKFEFKDMDDGSGTIDSASLEAIIDSDYILNKVNGQVLIGQGFFNYFNFIASQGQTQFTGADINGNVLDFEDNAVQVFSNGVLYIQNEDYTVSNGNTITLTTPALAGEEIYINSFSTLFLSPNIPLDFPGEIGVTKYRYITTSGQTEYIGADINGNILDLANKTIDVYSNGILLVETEDYIISTNPSKITTTVQLAVDTEITIITTNVKVNFAYEDIIDSNYVSNRIDEIYGGTREIDKFKYFASQGQTQFTGLDVNGNTLDYDAGHIQVFANGILLTENNDYITNSAGDTITFNTTLDSQDAINIHSFKTRYVLEISDIVDSSYVDDRVAHYVPFYLPDFPSTARLQKFRYFASQGQTVFSGSDDNGNTLSYSNGNILIYLNGVLIVEGSDYTANDGSTITIQQAINTNDEIVIISMSQMFKIDLDSTYINSKVAGYLNNSFPDTEATVDVFKFTATAGQVAFSDGDDNGNTLSYNPGNILVHLNGILLTPDDYTATNGAVIIITPAASLNDELVVTSFSKYYIREIPDEQLTTLVNTAINNQVNAVESIVDSDYVAARATISQGVEEYAAEAQLPFPDTVGSLAFVTGSNTLYVWDGSAWKQIYSGPNDSPLWTTSPPSSLTLNLGDSASTLTIAAEDPEGFPITYGVDVNPSNQTKVTIVNNNDGTFTLTPDSDFNNYGDITARFTANDGLNFSSAYSTISLIALPQMANLIGWYDFRNTNTYPGTGTDLYDLSTAGNNQTINLGSATYGAGIGGTTILNFATNTNIPFDTNIFSNVNTAIIILSVPNDGADNQTVLWGPGGSAYVGVMDPASAADVGNTFTWTAQYVNGTTVGTRQAAWNAMDANLFNSYAITGIGGAAANGFQLNNYGAEWSSGYEVQAILFWDVALSQSEVQQVHNSFSSMTTWNG